MPASSVQIAADAENFFQAHRFARKRLLALTYEFNGPVVERAFAAVWKTGAQIDVIAGVEYQEAVTNGMRVWRARWPGTFHPKIICLLADAHVRIGLGSANLTAGGLGENLEVWRYFEGKKDRCVLSGVRKFLEQLLKKNIVPKGAKMEEFVAALPEGDGEDLLSTLSGSLYSQVTQRVTKARHVDIVSPIYGSPSRLVSALKKKTGGTYRLYTGGPVPRIDGISEYFELKRGENNADDETAGVAIPVHAKMYAFEGQTHVDLFWGSANLSHPAWSAKNKRANIEFLVHSRVSTPGWQAFRKHLPGNHRWKKITHNGAAPKLKLVPEGRGWALLHASVEGGRVWIEANQSRKDVSLELRGEERHSAQTLTLTFGRDGAADVCSDVAESLGFRGHGDGPRCLRWRVGAQDAWRLIPVNRLDLADRGMQELDLAQQLFQEYAGRLLPRPPGSLGHRGDDTIDDDQAAFSPDEEELMQFPHQGALDRFVLEWRAIARRLDQACEGNGQLRDNRVAQVLLRIVDEAKRAPNDWPAYRQAFVRGLLERSWPK